MIFVAVGTQFPFDRLVKAVDDWASEHCSEHVVGQIGPSSYTPSHIEAHAFLEPARFDWFMRRSTLLVAHAGMGSILAALQLAKPIIILPRRADLGEHRNDHQLATASRFVGRPGIYVADEVAGVCRLLNKHRDLVGGAPISSQGSNALIESLRDFIAQS